MDFLKVTIWWANKDAQQAVNESDQTYKVNLFVNFQIFKSTQTEVLSQGILKTWTCIPICAAEDRTSCWKIYNKNIEKS